MLEAEGFDVVGQAADAEDLVRKVGAHRPDAITDIRMPPTHTDDGLRAAVEIRRAHPDVGVLVLSQYIEADYALELIGGDARRRRLPAQGPHLGHRGVRGRDQARGVRRFRARPGGRAPMLGRRNETSALSDMPREHEVLGLLAQGCSNAGGVASRIVINQRSVEKHVTSIMSKLGLPSEPEAHRRVLAVLAYLERRGRRPGPGAG